MAENSKHPKPVSKFSFTGEHKSLGSKIGVVSRNVRNLSKHKEVNTTGLSDVKIDEAIEGLCGSLPTEELNGIVISDPTNEMLLVRQNGVWKKLKVE